MSEHIKDHKKLYEAARSLRKTGMPLSWRADEISAVLDELIRLRHIVASGLAVSINQENKDLRFEVERLKAEIDRVKALNHQQFGDAIRKNAEVEALKRGMVGDYDLDAWLEFSTGAVQKNADRYQWLCDGNGYFLEEQGICGHSNEKPEADRRIDIAMTTGEMP